MNNEANVKENRKKSVFERIIQLDVLGDGTWEGAILFWLMIAVWVHYVASAVMMILLLGIVMLVPSTRKKILCDPKTFYLGVIIAVFSFLVSVISKNLIGMAIAFGVFMIITLGTFAKNVITEERFKKLQVICCIGSVVSVFIAVYQNAIYSPAYRPVALAYNPNYHGALIVMTMLICIYNVLDGKKTRGALGWFAPHKLFYIAVFLLNSVALLVGESRSSLLAFLVCAIFYLLITKRYILFAIALCLAVGIGTVGWFYPDVLSWTNSLAFSFTERSTIWKEAIRSFSQNPYTVLLGRGPMTYYHVMEAEGLFEANHAHNIFADTLLNVGIIGTALYLLLFASLLKEIVSAGKRGNKKALIFGMIFILEVIVQGIADVTIMWHQSAMLFLLAISIIGNENALNTEEKK